MQFTEPSGIFQSESAVSSVVGAVLVLGLLILISGSIQVYYVPEWISDAEYAHMDDTFHDMADLKTTIDIISAVITVEPTYKFSTDIPVDMGGGTIPMINSRKSSGTLSINDQRFDMNISAINGSGTVYDSGTDLRGLGTILYSSRNNYYIDQTFMYENGALILAQDDGSILRLSPGLSFSRPASDTIQVSINAIKVQGATRSLGSSGVEEIRILSNASATLYSGGVVITDLTIDLGTDYPSAWADYLNMSARNAGLIYGSNYTITSSGSSVNMVITGTGEDIQLSVKRTIVDVSTGIPG